MVRCARVRGAPTFRSIRDVALPTAGSTSGPDSPVRRARLLTLVWLATSVLTCVWMPAIGLGREPSVPVAVLGAIGIGLFFVAQSVAVWIAVTPWASARTRRAVLVGFVVTAVLSVVLVAPVASGRWATWAWVGAAVVGTTPLLWRPRTAALVSALTVAASAAVALVHSASVPEHLVITAAIGASIAAVNWAPVWLWELLVHAEQGRAAQARLVATEERLRFARDVHDLLGHDLTVIALKAELAARTAESDPAGAAREAGEVRRLAASSLDRVRATVAGYRAVDLPAEVDAVAELLRASGVRCEVQFDAGLADPTAAVSEQLSAVLREATTNVLRHSRAGWCRIGLSGGADGVELTVANDGADDADPDPRSFGLRGLAERLAETGGSLRTRASDGVFTLVATVRAAV